MKKYYIMALAACLGLASLSSCSGDLDLKEKGVTTVDEYYQTDDEATSAVVTLYSRLHDLGTSYLMVKNALSDDCYIGGVGMPIDEVNEFRFTSDNAELTSLFQGYYNIIYAANIIINKVEPNTAVKSRAVAEAKYFRGWAYFELTTLWGPVPLITEAIRDNYRESNSTEDKIWAQIETDLKEAVASNALPSKSNVNDKDTPVRITKEAAEAMLGKAYLWEKKYAEANTQFDAVINSGLYAMMPLGSDGYLGYASYRNDNNSEVMLQINRLNDASAYGTELTCMFVGLPATNFLGTNNGRSPFYGECWGFSSGTRDGLVEAFLQNAKKNGVDDERYLTTIYSVQRLESEFGLTVKPGGFFQGSVGYFTTKYASLNENHIPMTWAGFQQNTTLMRYAEVLLLAAESHLMAGDQANALKYVNIIRQHAGEPQLTTVTLDDIKLEKRLELCNECVRYQDLLRWGDAYNELKDQGKRMAYYGYLSDSGKLELQYPETQFKKDAGFKQNKNELLPFPYAEMNVNPNIKQNPGY